MVGAIGFVLFVPVAYLAAYLLWYGLSLLCKGSDHPDLKDI